MITVWGRASSSNLQKVTWTLDELGVEYERHDRGREFGGTDTADYLAMNPNGLVPTIRDGDLVLWESHAICRYLARTYEGEGLLPSDPSRAAQVEKWMDWNASHLAPSVFPMFLAAREAKDMAVAKEPRFEKTVAAGRKNLQIMNDQLAGQDYLAGDAFTLADMICCVTAARWIFVGYDLEGLENVAAWFDRCNGRPAGQRHNLVSF